MFVSSPDDQASKSEFAAHTGCSFVFETGAVALKCLVGSTSRVGCVMVLSVVPYATLGCEHIRSCSFLNLS